MIFVEIYSKVFLQNNFKKDRMIIYNILKHPSTDNEKIGFILYKLIDSLTIIDFACLHRWANWIDLLLIMDRYDGF